MPANIIFLLGFAAGAIVVCYLPICLDKICHWHQYQTIRKIEKIINSKVKEVEILGVRQVKIFSPLWFNMSFKPEYIFKVRVTDQSNCMKILFIGVYFIPYPWRIWEQLEIGLEGEMCWEDLKENNVGLIEFKDDNFYLKLKEKTLPYIPECD